MHSDTYYNSTDKNPYCRLCWKCQLPRSIFTSHFTGAMTCPQLSHQDKMRLNAPKMSNMKEDEIDLEEDPAAINGYDDSVTDLFNIEDSPQVVKKMVSTPPNISNNFSEAKLGYIQPEPTQILTLFQVSNNDTPAHIELDSGASLNYTEEREAIKRGFKSTLMAKCLN